ncbi:per1-like protein PGAP3 isoform 1-T1 [Glossina fuscipes fuscipes]
MIKINKSLLICLILISIFLKCLCSNGDKTVFFKQCRQNCERQNCSADGIKFQEQAIKYYQQTLFDKLFLWNCVDECQYGCMWRTVEVFKERGWAVPQFYGKKLVQWPFIRFMGLQEPASVYFSILNFVAHVRNIKRFRREVRPDSPCYKLWHLFAFVCLNGWLWSIIFHARDLPLTELLDYAFAYSMVLVVLYCMLLRMLHRKSILLRGFISLGVLSYYINYFAYLSAGKFSYSTNMVANVVTGVLGGLGWILWSFRVRHYRPYYRKIQTFYLLMGLSMSLELLDFRPILWIIDAHALWHLSTAFLAPLFYSFVIEDCKMLRTEHKDKAFIFDKEI